MNEKVAFVCPIYDSKNHFEYGKKLLMSKIDNKISGDLFFVFSNKEQMCKFKKEIEDKAHPDFLFLILPIEYADKKSQVTIKKFWGLKNLKNLYEYIFTIDSECVFTKKCDVYKMANEIWNNRCMMNSNISPDGFGIMRSCYKTLGIYNNNKLKKETQNYKYNVWFNEIPIYKTSLLDEFFCWIESCGDEYENNWYCFDYLIFIAFLIICKDYKLIKHKVISLGGVNEFLYVFNRKKQNKIIEDFKSHWLPIDRGDKDYVFMRFHLDRNEDEGKYHSKDFNKQIIHSWIVRTHILISDMIKKH